MSDYYRDGGALLSQPKRRFVSPWQERIELSERTTEGHS